MKDWQGADVAHGKLHAMLQVDIECFEEKQEILMETMTKIMTVWVENKAYHDVPSLFPPVVPEA